MPADQEQKVSANPSSPPSTKVSTSAAAAATTGDKKQRTHDEKDRWELLHSDLKQLETTLQNKIKLDPTALWCERLIGWGVLRIQDKEVRIRVNFRPIYWMLHELELFTTSRLKFLCCELATLPETSARIVGAMMVAVIAATQNAELNDEQVFGPIDWSHMRSDLGRRVQTEIVKECTQDESEAAGFTKWAIACEEARKFLEEKNMCPANVNSNFALVMRWCLLALTPAYTNRDSKSIRNPLVLLPPRNKNELPKEVGFYYKRLDAWCRKYGLSAKFFASVFDYFPPIARSVLTPAECASFSVEKTLLVFANGDAWISKVEPFVAKCFPVLFNKQQSDTKDADFSLYSAVDCVSSPGQASAFYLDKCYLFSEPASVRPLHISHSSRARNNLVWLDFPVKQASSSGTKNK